MEGVDGMKNNYNKNDPTYEAPTPTGSNLRIIGDRCYAYSGAVTITSGADAYRTLLRFNTTADALDLDFQVGSEDATGSDLYYKVIINDATVLTQVNTTAYQTNTYGFSPLNIIVPPFAKVEFTAKRGSGSDYEVYGLITGNVLRGMDPTAPPVVTDRLL